VAKATLILPRLLHDSVGVGKLRVEGRTLKDAFEDAYRKLPTLRRHLCADGGGFRAHVLCFLNDDQRPLDTPLKDGDEILIAQAISGG